MLVFGFFPFIFKELYNPWLEWEVPETPFMGTDNEKERGVLFVGGWFWVFYIKQLVFICLENDKSDLRSNYLIFLCPYPYTYFFLHLISSCVLSFFFFFFQLSNCLSSAFQFCFGSLDLWLFLLPVTKKLHVAGWRECITSPRVPKEQKRGLGLWSVVRASTANIRTNTKCG